MSIPQERNALRWRDQQSRAAYLEHREELTGGFTKKYGVKRLVWYRDYCDIGDAIVDEKRIKRWRRKWKLEMIEAMNPGWIDLYETLNG